MSVFTKTAVDIFAAQDSSGAKRKVANHDVQVWGTEVERLFKSFIAGGGIIFETKAEADANLNYAANTMAWVLGDPVAGNNGVYQKDGASGSGSWQRLGDLPYSFILATNTNSGDPNAIEATAFIPIPAADGGALIALPIVADNTASPVTVSFNGGPALTIKTIAGNDVPATALAAGMIVWGFKQGDEFRLATDLASAGILSGAEEAALRAEDAADAVSGIATTVIDPQFPTKAIAEQFSPAFAPDYIRTAGYAAAGDGGGALYKKVASEPSHAGKFSITLADGVTVVWYEIAENVLTERMFGVVCDGDWEGGGTDSTQALANWASCPVSNRKKFTGVSTASTPIAFLPGTILEGDGFDTGIDFSGSTSITSGACVTIDNPDGLVQISNLAANVAHGDTMITLQDGSNVEPGDWICIYNPAEWSWVSAPGATGGRASYHAGEWVRVMSVDGGDVVITEPTWAGYQASAVEVYRMRSPSAQVRNFRIKPPYTECAGLRIDVSIQPIVEHLQTDGSHYAGIVMQRCIDEYVNCDMFQREQPGTPSNEYCLVQSSCHGGEIHGQYHAQRHGIAFGNAEFVCNVPNRKVRVFADTSSSHGVGSLDMGHGCTEGLTAIGGSHTGITIGGKNHKFIGLRSRKGRAQQGGGEGGVAVAGSEIVGGKFVFSDCELASYANTLLSPGAPAPFNVTLLEAVTEPVNFILSNCGLRVHQDNTYPIRIQLNGCAHKPSIVVDGIDIENGQSVTQMIRLQYIAAGGGQSAFELVWVQNVRGLRSSASYVELASGATADTLVTP